MSNDWFDARSADAARFAGVYTAVVRDNRDPERLGRIKVSLPWLPDGYTSDWIRVATAMSGAGFGVVFLPEPGDLVLVAFEHADPAYPVVIGSLWGGERLPPRPEGEAGDDANDRRLIRSRSGHQLLFDDTPGEERVVVQERSGKTSLTLESSSGDVVLSIGGEQLRLRASAGAITLQTSADLKLELRSLSAEVEQASKIAAAQLELTATNGVAITSLAGVNINDGALEVT